MNKAKISKFSVHTPESLAILLHNQAEICSERLVKVTPQLMKEMVKFGIGGITYRGEEGAVVSKFTKDQVKQVINISLDSNPLCCVGFEKGQVVIASIGDSRNLFCFNLSPLVKNALGNFMKHGRCPR